MDSMILIILKNMIMGKSMILIMVPKIMNRKNKCHMAMNMEAKIMNMKSKNNMIMYMRAKILNIKRIDT